MPKTLETQRHRRGTTYLCGELRWRRPPLPADATRWMGAQAQASPASPYATGEVHGSAGGPPLRQRRLRQAGPVLEKVSGAIFLEAMQQRWPWAATQNLCSCSERRRRNC
jgi:hypothetical protein